MCITHAALSNAGLPNVISVLRFRAAADRTSSATQGGCDGAARAIQEFKNWE
jgi:hypothetical protein